MSDLLTSPFTKERFARKTDERIPNPLGIELKKRQEKEEEMKRVNRERQRGERARIEERRKMDCGFGIGRRMLD